MLIFILRRIMYMLVTLFVVSIVSFIVIQLPPGDYVTSYVSGLIATGEMVETHEVDALRARYGLGQPAYVQYLKWMNGILHGDLGRSLEWNSPVMTLIKDRLPWSFTISLVSFIFVWVIGLPIGIYSATNQYSLLDYVATFIGFIGLAVPSFLVALLALWFYFQQHRRRDRRPLLSPVSHGAHGAWARSWTCSSISGSRRSSPARQAPPV